MRAFSDVPTPDSELNEPTEDGEKRLNLDEFGDSFPTRGPEFLAPLVGSETKYARSGSAESFVDDLNSSRGVVLGRAATTLRSVETHPLTGGIRPQ